MDKLQILKDCLIECIKHSEAKIKELESKLETKGSDPNCDMEEYLTLGMEGCYLNGITKGVQFVINIIEDGKIDKIDDLLNTKPDEYIKA